MSNPPFSFGSTGCRRSPVFGRDVVATSSPAAAQVGLSVMRAGGNAIDAAVAVAAALSVVEPTMNGVGGDLFALVWDGAELHGLNASGRSPMAWSLERFAARGAIPELGWDAVTVPGAVSGWVALHDRFGSRPFAELLAPAIGLARAGFPVLPKMAGLWADAAVRFAEFGEFRRVFLPHGRAPRAGERFTLPDLARSLEQIAETRGAALYHGELAERIAEAARIGGGAVTREDLAQHAPSFVAPIGVDFHGARVCEPPPNGQGLAALIALGILRHLPLDRLGPEHPDAVHFQLEAMKLAFADCRRHVADPARMRISTDELLSEARLSRLAERISASRAALPLPGPRPDQGTVYASLADRDGRMVSLIQSNYLGFGSGVVVPHTGISLQNRGLGFSLDPDHPNAVAGGALPYHTIMPGMLLEGGKARMSFGVMGGHMQPQGHVQMVLRTWLFQQDPQAACDAPRWYVAPDGSVALEPELHAALGTGLRERGHTLIDAPPTLLFGGAQLIYQLDSFYCAGSDPRKDGQAVGL
ncbi:MAG TPA: gamma-glutamyltransferase family protein [Polyangiaceae bacterium]|nr:gamma-glutamyltransferase family protein [Polyangiaceae bacterium]